MRVLAARLAEVGTCLHFPEVLGKAQRGDRTKPRHGGWAQWLEREQVTLFLSASVKWAHGLTSPGCWDDENSCL